MDGRQRLLGMVLLGGAGLLAGCGGGSNQPEQPTPLRSEITGTFSLGDTPPAAFDVTVRGREGIARTASMLRSDGSFAVALDQLQGPYLLSNELGAQAFATGAGHVNLTPLTSLVVAEVLGDDPADVVQRIAGGLDGGNVALPPVDPPALAAAQAAVVRHLSGRLGLTLPSPDASFHATPFAAVAGDPMQQALAAYQDALAAAGVDAPAYARAMGLHAGHCRAKGRLPFTVGDVDPGVDFCPSSRSTRPDPANATVTLMNFIDGLDGDTLAVRVRAGRVISVRLDRAGGFHRCNSATACAAVELGAAQADGSRVLTFRDLALPGAAGTVRYRGTLTALAPGAVECPQFVGVDDGTGESVVCVTVAASTSGLNRHAHTARDADGVSTTRLVATTQGAALVSLVALRFDETLLRDVVLGRCRASACAGAVLGPAGADGARLLVLDGTALPAVDLAGQPTGAAGVTVRARLVLVPPEADALAPRCDGALHRVAVQPSDEPVPIDLCVLPPERADGFEVSGRFLQDDGEPGYFAASLVADEEQVVTGDSITVLTRDGAVSRVTLQRRDGLRYACEDGGCTGVGLTLAQGVAALDFAGTVLVEREAGDLPADRQATLQGRFEVDLLASPEDARAAGHAPHIRFTSLHRQAITRRAR